MTPIDSSEEAKQQLQDYVTRGKAAANSDPQQDEFSFQGVLPYPAGEWDYTWCRENWGTKWDINNESISNDEPQEFSVQFQTAWAPPEPYFIAASKMYPLLSFEWYADEEGMCFDPYEAGLMAGRVQFCHLWEDELRERLMRDFEDDSEDEDDPPLLLESDNQEVRLYTGEKKEQIKHIVQIEIYGEKQPGLMQHRQYNLLIAVLLAHEQSI